MIFVNLLLSVIQTILTPAFQVLITGSRHIIGTSYLKTLRCHDQAALLCVVCCGKQANCYSVSTRALSLEVSKKLRYITVF